MAVVRSPLCRDFHPHPSRKKMPRRVSRHFSGSPEGKSRLLHHFQARPAARTRWLGVWRWYIITAFAFDRFVVLERRLQIKHHALAILTGIDPENRANWHEQRMGHAAKTPFEADSLVVHVQVAHGTG